ncbi:MAG TPA: hypothetical protein P5526_10305 [Anaerolineae bacterium]|nr:hypothetical protein [Anaerolineae bacterium]MCB0223758.1 hypothetical protein [Anaerolineae bacterium]MCB9106963.1 hypothetical protein [Anaerolineales bacterium]HRV92542.1 hypothetical protein [Anaerolineae bacterium]
MAEEVTVTADPQEGRFGSCLLWFIWGVSLSFTTILALVMMALLSVSIALNVYLSWQLAGLELSITRRGGDNQIEMPVSGPTTFLVAVPTQTPVTASVGAASTPAPVSTGAPVAAVPPDSELMSQYATLAAIATQSAASAPLNSAAAPVQINPPAALSAASTPTPQVLPPSGSAAAPIPVISPTAIPPAVAIGEPAIERESAIQGADNVQSDSGAPAEAAAAGSREEQPTDVQAEAFSAPSGSSNSYELVPLEGEKDKRPAAEHGDLNLALREPEPIDQEPALKDVGAGIDPGAPNLGAIFSPDIVQTYGIHNWDWGCNCKGDLIDDGKSILVGIKTTPGDPIFIPPTTSPIFGGEVFAVVLYASEDSLTFAYARDGTVAQGYAIHYQGLHVDPNLLAKYNEATGNDVVGLTLDTPVGVAASDELLVAVRDKGTFMDSRSINDWWK